MRYLWHVKFVARQAIMHTFNPQVKCHLHEIDIFHICCTPICYEHVQRSTADNSIILMACVCAAEVRGTIVRNSAIVL